MPVKIRLTRMGTKKKPIYRIIATNTRTSRDGAFFEVLGSYNPHRNPILSNIKTDLIHKWISFGAQFTNTARSLLKAHGLWRKK